MNPLKLDTSWHDFIQRHYGDLHQKMQLSVGFLQYMMKHKVLTKYLIVKIIKLQQNHDRISLFLRYLSKRNPQNAETVFAEALYLSDQREVLDMLELHGRIDSSSLDMRQRIYMGDRPVVIKHFEESSYESSLVSDDKARGFDEAIRKYYFRTTYGIDLRKEFYDSFPGLCVIINIENFKRPNGKARPELQRSRSSINVDSCERCFVKLGYEIMKFSDLTEKDFKHTFEHIRQALVKNRRLKSLVVVLMSHGVQDIIYSSDIKPILLNMVYAEFSPETFQNMGVVVDCPKIFLVQACQELHIDTRSLKGMANYADFTLTNMCSIFATTPGAKAERDELTGASPFIEKFVELINKYGHLMTLDDIVKKVADHVQAETETNQISNIRLNTLKKMFLFDNLPI